MSGNASPKAQYWGYTLNNYTAEELILVRNATTVEPIIEHVYTPEKGENGTPHIQGFLKCSRQVRRSHLTKHWLLRAHLTALNSDDYRANMKDYVQKQDATATAPTHQTRRIEPVLYPAVVPEMLVRWIDEHTEEHSDGPTHDTLWFWVRDSLTQQQKALLEEIGMESSHWRRAPGPDGLEWFWKKAREPIPFPTHAAPLDCLVELAKRELVQLMRVETLVDRPEVTRAVRSYYREILRRMNHSSENAPDDETHVSAEEDSVTVPTHNPSSDPPSPPG